MSSEGEMVLVEIESRVALLTLARPQRRNALTAAMIRRLRAAVSEVDESDAVDAIILTGSGESFCAGLDLDELGSSGENLVEGGKGPPVPPLQKPLIGAINGPAVAGGLELALHCDFLIASENARFADTHARVGVIPGWGAATFLPHVVGPRNALALSLSGRFFGADEALRLGMVSEVVAAADLMPRARQRAAQIVANDGPTVRALLALMRQTAAVSPVEGLRLEAEATAAWAAQVRERDVAERRQSIFQRNASC